MPAAASVDVAASPNVGVAPTAGHRMVAAVRSNASHVPQGALSSDPVTAGKPVAPVATAGVDPAVTADMSSAVTHMGMATMTGSVPASVPMMMLREGA